MKNVSIATSQFKGKIPRYFLEIKWWVMAQIIHFTLVSLVLSKHRDLKCQQVLFINNENSSSIRIFCLHSQIECLDNSSLYAI